MIAEKSLGVYKNRPAVVSGTGEKISILLPGGGEARVREKDIEIIHPGPASDPAAIENAVLEGDVRGAWELLEADSGGDPVSLKEAAELIYGNFSPQSAWAVYCLIKDGLYFTGSPGVLIPRSAEEVASGEERRTEKNKEASEREAFLERLRAGSLSLPDDGRYLQDAEALACGRSDKSRTLRDLGKPETAAEAHKLLLASGYWTPFVNPHPSRYGVSVLSAKEPIGSPPEEDRADLSGLKAYAIDNAWSADPDDAVSIEGNTLYVHVADPAASVSPGSKADIEARKRGATLYLPEGPARMLAEESLSFYALGLSPLSASLTFKITLREDGSIEDTEIFPSLVKVRRMTYAEADAEAESDPALSALFSAARRNIQRRIDAGAIMMEFPEAHFSVAGETVSIEPIVPSRSAEMVRECMLLAGEGAAAWALKKRVPFPFVGQETGDLPNKLLPGPAGFFQLRKCMRPRSLSLKPSLHAGLGLDVYTQVTSPLRRYTDLLAHQQIRSVLTGREALSQDELLLRLGTGEAGAMACIQAERASKAHWTAVYLSQRKGSTWEGIILEKKGNRAVAALPALAMETQVSLKGGELNDTVELVLSSVNIAEAEMLFIQG
ncbi:RNB domain-containing ribonuclease [Treponema sp. OttesenSCG-928-L16]|nr:RNB domain-containing ribonuclease [Treponema sp. OttesenSCG-928-L16]